MAQTYRFRYVYGMTTIQEAITTDPRFQASGPGGCDTIYELLHEFLPDEDVSRIGLEASFLRNSDAWRPSDSMRRATRSHFERGPYSGCTA